MLQCCVGSMVRGNGYPEPASFEDRAYLHMVHGTSSRMPSLTRSRPCILLLLALVLACVLATGCATTPSQGGTPTPTPTATTPATVTVTPTPTAGPGSCTGDSDCVPAQCCHPTTCVNRAYAEDCAAVLCTLSCEGPIDCGAGHCGCVSGTCRVIPNPTPTPTVTRGGYYY